MIFYFLFLSLKWRRMYLNDKFSSSFPEFKYEGYIAFLSFSLQENMLSEERVSSFIFQAICTLNNWVVTVLLVYLRGKLFVNKKKGCSEIPHCLLYSYNPLITRNNKANFDKILIITALQKDPTYFTNDCNWNCVYFAVTIIVLLNPKKQQTFGLWKCGLIPK